MLTQRPAQSVWPAGHAHAPAVHTCPVGQALPQAPQCMALVCSSVSQPLSSLMSQLPEPVLHIPTVQRPAVQAAVALARRHCVPQAPQWLGFDWVSMQRLAPISGQHISPVMQRGAAGSQPRRHMRLTHTSPLGQSALVVHWAQVKLVQRWPVGQCVSVTHSTQRWAATLQRGVAGVPAQSVSLRQPGMQVRVPASQYWPTAHTSIAGVHWTQRRELVSQTGPPAMPMQSALVAQPVLASQPSTGRPTSLHDARASARRRGARAGGAGSWCGS